MVQTEPGDTRGASDDLTALFDAARDLVGVSDEAGRLVALSPWWDPGGGARRVHDLVAEADAGAVDAGLAAARGGRATSWRARCRGTGIRCLWRMSPCGSAHCYVSATPSAADDQTARAVVEGVGVGLSLLDAAGQYRYVNQAYCRMCGYAAHELLGRPFTIVLEPSRRAEAWSHHEAILRGEAQNQPRELQVRRKDGSPMLADMCSRRIDLPQGERVRLATVLEVTERRSGELRLAEAEAHLRDLTNAVPGALYQFRQGPHGDYVVEFMSEGLRRITGLDDDVPLDFDTILAMVPADHREALLTGVDEAVAGRRGWHDVFPLDAPSGRVWLHGSSQPHLDPEGNPVWSGVLIDITQHKEAEARLAEAEARQRDITSSLPGAVYQVLHELDGSRRLTYMSEGLRRLGGFDATFPLTDLDAFLGLVPEPEREQLVAAMRRAGEHLEPLDQEFRLATPAGTIWVEARSVPTERPDGRVVCNGLIVDVTQRHEAQAEAERLTAILGSTPDCVAITHTDGRIRYLNAGGYRLLGLDPAEPVVGRELRDFLTPAAAARTREEAIPQARREGTWSGESSVITAAGSEIPVSQTVLCHVDASGRITHFSVTIRDLSDRVRAERELAASEARFRSLYDETPVMLHTLDREFRLTGVNAHWLETMGYARDDVIGRPLEDFYADEVREWIVGTARHEYLRAGSLREMPARLVRADGSLIDVLLSVNATYDADGDYTGALAAMTDVTRQRQAEAGYREIFENTSEGIYRSTPDGRLLRANPALARLHGCPTEEALLEAIDDIATDWYVDPEARQRLVALVERDGYVENFEAEIQRLGTNQRIWTSENVRVVRDDSGAARYYEGTVRDITAEHRARRLAARRSEILEMVARDAPLTRTLYEIVGTVEEVYGRVTAAVLHLQDDRLSVAAAPGLSNPCIRALDGAAPCEVGGALGQALQRGRAAIDTQLDAGSPAFVHAARKAGYGTVFAVPVHDQRGTVLGAVAAFAQFAMEAEEEAVQLLNEMAQIVSIALEQYRLSQQLVHQAHYDALTDLPNRALLADRLEQALSDAGRGDYAVAVLLIDLDDFKLVNDTLGHSAGDELLQQVGGRLRACLRAGDTVARLGGDEFVLIVPLRNGIDPTDIAERVLAALQDSALVAGHEVSARPSIGLGIFPDDGRTPEALLQAADTAMYAAKNAGKNRFRYFAEDMNDYMGERLRIEAELRAALERTELELHYQPRVDLDDGSIVGAEALLRWQHPQRGTLGPGEFLGFVERSPLIGDIDRWVLRAAAQQAASWQRARRGLVVSANLSTRELHADGFAADAARILAEAGVDPGGLELEITESMLMYDFDRASRQLCELRERAPGLRIAIDDFGSGYSSLNYLRHLPIDTLKIDRAFVADLVGPEAATASAIARTVAELGRNLGLTVVAEGVERAEQAERLPHYGCHQAQGFWYAPALPVDEFDRRLQP